MWGTNYALDEFPRMTGIESDATTVVVAFSAVPSAGD
jgi:hypothetical protein